MTTDRRAYKIDPSNPGSDLAGETAAAMAAASVVFRHYNPGYANELLSHARQVSKPAFFSVLYNIFLFYKILSAEKKWKLNLEA